MPVQHLLGLPRQSKIRYQLCHLWLHAVFGHLMVHGGRLLTVPWLLGVSVEVGLEDRVSNLLLCCLETHRCMVIPYYLSLQLISVHHISCISEQC